MNREFLKEQGLSDEQIEAVMKEHSKTVNSLKEDVDKVKELEGEIDNYKQTISDRDKQLKDLSNYIRI